jgi:hypothetical protein
MAYLADRADSLVAELRPGNASANTAGDHVAVLLSAMEQLPEQAWAMEMLLVLFVFCPRVLVGIARSEGRKPYPERS